MVKLVMLISLGLAWPAAFGHGPWNRDEVGKEQIWDHRNFSLHHPGHNWSYHKNHSHQQQQGGQWGWHDSRPHQRPPPFNQEENTTVVWPNLDQDPETTTAKFIPLVNMRPALGSASISQSSPILNLTEAQFEPTQRPTPTLQAEINNSGSTAGTTTTTPKPSIQHNSDDDYDWAALGLEGDDAVANRISRPSNNNRLRCRRCRQRFLKNLD